MQKNKFISLFIMLILIISFVAFPSNSDAASSSKTVTSYETMSLYLPKQTTGNSNSITFNFSSLPEDAIVTKILVDASTGMTSGGNGAIVSNNVFIKGPDMNNYVSTPWGSGNKTTITTGVIGKLAKGTWSIYYNGSNVSTLSDAYKQYKNVKVTIHYSY